MTIPTPILTLDELDEIERYARLYDDVFYGFLPAHPSGRWDAYLPEYREKAIRAMAAVFERRALLQRQEAGDNPLSEMEMNYEGALSDCQSAITVLIRRINGEADLASAAEWIRLNYPKRAAELVQPRSPTPSTAPTPSRKRIAKEIASFACRRHLINSNAYEALADRIFALINGAPK